jgi:hypothetical protein
MFKLPKQPNRRRNIADMPSETEGVLMAAVLAGDGQTIVEGVSFSPKTTEKGPLVLMPVKTFRDGVIVIGPDSGDDTGRCFFPNNGLTIVLSKNGGNDAEFIEIETITPNPHTPKVTQKVRRHTEVYGVHSAHPLVPEPKVVPHNIGQNRLIDVAQYDFVKVCREGTSTSNEAVVGYVSAGRLTPEQEAEFTFIDDAVGAIQRANALSAAARAALNA